MLTKAQVGALNDARDVLRAIEKQATSESYSEDSVWQPFDCGKLAEACDSAEGAMFNVLNVARSYLGIKLTDEQIHNRPQETEVPEPEKVLA